MHSISYALKLGLIVKNDENKNTQVECFVRELRISKSRRSTQVTILGPKKTRWGKKNLSNVWDTTGNDQKHLKMSEFIPIPFFRLKCCHKFFHDSLFQKNSTCLFCCCSPSSTISSCVKTVDMVICLHTWRYGALGRALDSRRQCSTVIIIYIHLKISVAKCTSSFTWGMTK